jgi:RsiW-degrading membrane proteinase PrsW (M82 family)
VAEPPVYFAFTGGRQIGPLHFAEMADLAARGTLQPDDLAWKSGTPEWVPASQLLAFPKRKPASGVQESPAVSPKAREPEGEILSVAEAPVSGPSPAVRPLPLTSLPPKWPRISLARVSDDPGIGLVETGVGREAGGGESQAGGTSEGEDPRSISRLAQVLPVRRLNDAAVLGSPVTWALVFFGLGPLFVSAVAEDPLLRIRLFDFGCGALWVVFFYAAFRTESVTSRTVLAVFFGSVLLAILYFGLLHDWPPVSTLAPWAAPGQGFGARLSAGLGGAALVQEFGKLALLLLIARSLGELNDGADGLFYGLITGAAFGLCASIISTGSLGLADESVLRGSGEEPSTALYAAFLGTTVRALSQPFLHAVWTAIAGTFLARGLPAAGRKAAPGRIAVGLGLAVVLHALFEALTPAATAFFSVLVAGAALSLLLALKRDTEEQPILTALH